MEEQATKDNASPDPGLRLFVRWATVSAIVVLLDQLTKWAISKWLTVGDTPIELTTFLYIVRRHNEGAAFSFLADASGWQRWFFITLASAVSAYIVHWLWRIRNEDTQILSAGLALVLGGAVGNLADRINYGYVIDFIDVYFSRWNYHFPAFNIADSAISVGAVLLIIDALFSSAKETAK